MNKEKLVGVGIVLALILGIVGIKTEDTRTVETRTVVEKPIQVGAAGPDLLYPFFNLNGSVTYVERQGFSQATTTVCSLPTPSATTTLESFTVDLRTGTTSAMLWEAGNATTRFATTTLIVKRTLAANTVATLVSTTTSLTDKIVAPNTYINVKAGGAPGGSFTSFAPTGTCSAVFRGI